MTMIDILIHGQKKGKNNEKIRNVFTIYDIY